MEFKGNFKDGIKVTIDELVKRGFNKDQISVLRRSSLDNIDVSYFCDKSISSDRMFLYYGCLEAGIDTNKYNLTEFSEAQLIELRNGASEGVDISEYADPRMSQFQMACIRDAMAKGEDYTLYKEIALNSNEAHILFCKIKENENAREYINELIENGHKLLSEKNDVEGSNIMEKSNSFTDIRDSIVDVCMYKVIYKVKESDEWLTGLYVGNTDNSNTSIVLDSEFREVANIYDMREMTQDFCIRCSFKK